MIVTITVRMLCSNSSEFRKLLFSPSELAVHIKLEQT